MTDFQDPEIYRKILNGLPMGIYLVDRDSKILFWNDAAEKITGYLRQEVLGRSCQENILMHGDDKTSRTHDAGRTSLGCAHQGESTEAEAFLHHQAGHRVPVLAQTVPLRDQTGAIVGAVESFKEHGTSVNYDRRRDTPREIGHAGERRARGDRSLASSRLAESMGLFKEHQVPLSIVLFQVEALEQFQAAYGLAAAEAILQVVARCLESNLRASDFVGAWNGRQFLAVLAGCSSGAETAAKRLSRLGSLSCIRWWGDPISIAVAWGSATAQAGDNKDSIVRRAESALGGSRANLTCINAERQ